MWDVSSGTLSHQRELSASAAAPLSCVAVSSVSPVMFAAGSCVGSGIIAVWDATSGDCVGEVSQSTGCLHVAFSPVVQGAPHLLGSAGHDGAVRLWTLPTLQTFGAPLRGAAGPTCALAFAMGDIKGAGPLTVVAAGVDCTVRAWDALTGAYRWQRSNTDKRLGWKGAGSIEAQMRGNRLGPTVVWNRACLWVAVCGGGGALGAM